MRKKRRPRATRSRFVRSVESGDAPAGRQQAHRGAIRRAACLPPGLARLCAVSRDFGQPLRLGHPRNAVHSALQRAFPFRRILAGANMFNEMPTKGRGRRA